MSTRDRCAPTGRHAGNRDVIEANFRRHAVETSATIPHDDRLRVMLDTGTYSLSALRLGTRVPVKELGAAIAYKCCRRLGPRPAGRRRSQPPGAVAVVSGVTSRSAGHMRDATQLPADSAGCDSRSRLAGVSRMVSAPSSCPPNWVVMPVARRPLAGRPDPPAGHGCPANRPHGCREGGPLALSGAECQKTLETPRGRSYIARWHSRGRSAKAKQAHSLPTGGCIT